MVPSWSPHCSSNLVYFLTSFSNFSDEFKTKKKEGKTPKSPYFLSFVKLRKDLYKNPSNLFYYQCEEKAITLINYYLTFSKDSNLVDKDSYILNFWKFICNINLFGLSYQVDRLI